MGGEEVGVDAARIAEHEAKSGFVLWVDIGGGVDGAEEFEHAPQNESQEKGISIFLSFSTSSKAMGLRSVSSQDQETHRDECVD